MSDLTWVDHVMTVDAVKRDTVAVLDANPGWRLIATGTGEGGQTTLTYGWGWPGPAAPPAPAQSPLVMLQCHVPDCPDRACGLCVHIEHWEIPR